MFVKSLVSIYFSENSILVAELDSGRKKVKKIASTNIPEGIVINSKVLDKKKLAESLKSIWSDNNFKSRDIGLIIPEFSTFTKLVNLPKLATSEIGEAVEWQAQEYLPTGTQDMVLDWKILEKSETSTVVLLVAVSKKILMDFVDACVMADLFPVSVETPSISIGNIIKSDDGFLAVVKESSGILIIAGEKNKILATSTIDSSRASDISDSLSKIVKHFSKVNFKYVFIGGGEVDDALAQNIKASLKIDVSVLDPKINGITPSEIQKYLIPISMLTKPVAEPMDPSTLNLLPANLVGKYQSQKSRTQIWSLTLTITVFVWISLLVVLGSFMVLGQQITTLKSLSQKNAQVAAERQKSETQATAINKISSEVLKIKGSSYYPGIILNSIFNAKPVGVVVNGYDMDLDKGAISLRGISVDRQSLVTFKENLEKVSEFRSINIPISSFESVADLTFSINFIYEPNDNSVVNTNEQKM